MSRPLRSASLTLILTVLLSGCAGGVELSTACIDDMEEAATITDPAAADPVLIRTLTSCETAEQWLEALRRNPGAMGLNELAEIGDIDLQAACFGNEDTPVCESRTSS